MQFEKINNKGQATLFRNRYLELLTKTHPLLIWGIYLPIIYWMLRFSNVVLGFSATRICVVFLAAVLAWSLFEYLAHRFLFHWVAQSGRMQKIIYTLHGNHHHYPRDKQRLFMPPVPSLIISATLFAVFYLAMTDLVFIFFPGFITGYLLYASMHYAIHAWRPPARWLKPLWRNHHLHHYSNDEKGFGVSSTLWDHVFGTMFTKNKADKKR